MPQLSVALAKTKAVLWTSLAAGCSRRSGDESDECAEHDLHGNAQPPWWQAAGAVPSDLSLHHITWRALQTVGRCPSGLALFRDAPTHATLAQAKQTRAPCCVSTQSASARSILLTPMLPSMQVAAALQAVLRLQERPNLAIHGGGDLEKRDSRRQRVEVLDHKRHHPIVAAIPPATPTECDAKLKPRREPTKSPAVTHAAECRPTPRCSFGECAAH